MPNKTAESESFLQDIIASSWGVVVVALTAFSVLGIGDRENVLGVLCAMLALGALAAVQVFRRNARERKNLEESLRESEQRYNILLERFPNGISVLEKGRVVYTTLREQNCSAKSADEIIGKTFLEWFAPVRPPPKRRICIRPLDTS